MPALTWEQVSALDTFEWCLDPHQRRVGKSTILAIAIIRTAWRHRGTPIPLRELERPRHANEALARTVMSLLHTDPVWQSASHNRADGTLTIGEGARPYPGDWLPPGWSYPDSTEQDPVPEAPESDAAVDALLYAMNSIEMPPSTQASRRRQAAQAQLDRNLQRRAETISEEVVRRDNERLNREAEALATALENERRAVMSFPRRRTVDPDTGELTDQRMRRILREAEAEMSRGVPMPTPMKVRKVKQLPEPPPPPPRTMWDWIEEA